MFIFRWFLLLSVFCSFSEARKNHKTSSERNLLLNVSKMTLNMYRHHDAFKQANFSTYFNYKGHFHRQFSRNITFMARVLADGHDDFCTAVFIESDKILMSASCNHSQVSKSYVYIINPETKTSKKILIHHVYKPERYSLYKEARTRGKRIDIAIGVLEEHSPNWISFVTISSDPTTLDPNSAVYFMSFESKRQAFPIQSKFHAESSHVEKGQDSAGVWNAYSHSVLQETADHRFPP